MRTTVRDTQQSEKEHTFGVSLVLEGTEELITEHSTRATCHVKEDSELQKCLEGTSSLIQASFGGNGSLASKTWRLERRL